MLATLALLMTAPAAPTPPAPRPNIVIITVDALRADHLSRYGYARRTTPVLDRIFAESLELTNARTIEPLTAPALCSMLVSLPPHEHGATRNGLAMRAVSSSLPSELRRAGYRSAAFVGSWVLAGDATGLDAHFDHYDEVFDRKRWLGMFFEEGSAGALAREATRWIDRHRDRPFLAWLHFIEPHAPYEFRGHYAARVGIESRLITPAVDRYDTEIAHVDEAIGRFIDGLSRRGLMRGKTIVVITSDHGESFGEHGEHGHGRHLWDTTLRVPLAFHWPGRLRGMRIAEPAVNLDIAPTLLGLIGLPVPSTFRGVDWSAVLERRERVPDRTLLFEAHRGTVVIQSDGARVHGLLELATLRGSVKEILRTGEGTTLRFDVAGDPNELRPAPVERNARSAVRSMKSIVRKSLERPRPAPPPLEGALLRSLRSLGYLQ